MVSDVSDTRLHGISTDSLDQVDEVSYLSLSLSTHAPLLLWSLYEPAASSRRILYISGCPRAKFEDGPPLKHRWISLFLLFRRPVNWALTGSKRSLGIRPTDGSKGLRKTLQSTRKRAAWNHPCESKRMLPIIDPGNLLVTRPQIHCVGLYSPYGGPRLAN